MIESIDKAAKILAACMDYPWEHMPEQGRAMMRLHAKAVVEAAQSLLPIEPVLPESIGTLAHRAVAEQMKAKPVLQKCALCSDPARVGVVCDACHDSMGTKPVLQDAKGETLLMAALEAIRRALTEAGVKHEVLRGMAINVGLEYFTSAIPHPVQPEEAVARDAARWRRLVNASELPFPVATIADDPENDCMLVYGRERLEALIDMYDEISDAALSRQQDAGGAKA